MGRAFVQADKALDQTVMEPFKSRGRAYLRVEAEKSPVLGVLKFYKLSW
jgi:hypothetical protein